MDLINNIKKNPSLIFTFLEDDLKNIINIAKKEYFKNGTSLLSDEIYDKIVELLEEKKNYIEPVGFKSSKDNIILPYKLSSLNKFYDSDKFIKWKNKNKTNNYIITPKADGVCVLYLPLENKLYSRGNGIYGQDITHLLKYIKFKNKDLKNLKINAIRAELLMKKDVKNSRNIISGQINSKIPNKEICDNIFYKFYTIIHPMILPSTSLNVTNFIEHEIVNYDDLTFQYLNDIYDKYKLNLDYKIDGIVITTDKLHEINTDATNPKYSIAFKKNNIFGKTKILNIEWTKKKTNKLNPKLLVEEIELDGKKIKYLSGKNYNYLITNKIGIGSEIEITLSGNIIPNIYKIITHGDNLNLPDNIKIINNNIYTNEINNDINDILEIFKSYNIKSIGKKKLESIINYNNLNNKNKIKNIFDFLDYDILIPKTQKKTNELVINIKKQIKNTKINIIDLICSFHYLSSQKALLYLIIKNIKNFFNNNITDYHDIYDSLIKIKGISDKNIISLIDGLNEYSTNKIKLNKYFIINYY